MWTQRRRTNSCSLLHRSLRIQRQQLIRLMARNQIPTKHLVIPSCLGSLDLGRSDPSQVPRRRRYKSLAQYLASRAEANQLSHQVIPPTCKLFKSPPLPCGLGGELTCGLFNSWTQQTAIATLPYNRAHNIAPHLHHATTEAHLQTADLLTRRHLTESLPPVHRGRLLYPTRARLCQDVLLLARQLCRVSPLPLAKHDKARMANQPQSSKGNRNHFWLHSELLSAQTPFLLANQKLEKS